MQDKIANPTPRLDSILLEFIRLFFKEFSGPQKGVEGGIREGESAVIFESV